MRNVKISIILSSLIFLSQFNCNSPTSSVVDSRVYGSWNWINTTGGIAGFSFSTPPAIIIKFDKNGLFSFYRNDSLLANSKFVISYEKLEYLPDTSYVLKLIDTIKDTSINYKYFTISEVNTYEINNDTLRIWDNIMDGFFYTYIKAK